MSLKHLHLSTICFMKITIRHHLCQSGKTVEMFICLGHANRLMLSITLRVISQLSPLSPHTQTVRVSPHMQHHFVGWELDATYYLVVFVVETHRGSWV